MPATRIVIDVQPTFCAANKPNLVIGVTAEIIRAKKEKAAIVIVEYDGNGKTHSSLMNLLKGYALHTVVMKNYSDGGKEVVAAIKRKKYPYDYLRVCGVNIDCCVMSTINGIEKRLPKTKIRIVKSACEYASTKEFDWSGFQEEYLFNRKNIKVV